MLTRFKQMANANLIAAAVLAGVGLYIYSDVKGGIKALVPDGYGTPIARNDLAQRIKNAGGTVQATNTGTYYQIKGGVVKLDDFTPLRKWEKGLISADRFVPGDFLTRWALS